MIATTTISSTRVKPASDLRTTVFMINPLPVRILGAVGRDSAAGRPDVEDVRPVPEIRLALLLVRSQHPVGLARHRVDRYAPQELQLAFLELPGVETVHECIEVGWVSFRVGLLE